LVGRPPKPKTATGLRCGGNNFSIVNCLSIEELLKSVDIWRWCGQKFCGTLFCEPRFIFQFSAHK